PGGVGKGMGNRQYSGGGIVGSDEYLSQSKSQRVQRRIRIGLERNAPDGPPHTGQDAVFVRKAARLLSKIRTCSARYRLPGLVGRVLLASGFRHFSYV